MTHAPGTLESRLRALFVELRPNEGVPAALRSRVAALDDAGASRDRRWLRSTWLVGFAAAGVAVAAVVVAAFGFSRAPIIGLPPGGVGGAGVIGFDPAIEGPGMLSDYVRSAILVGLLVVIVGAAVAAGTFFSPRAGTNRGRAIILAGLLGVGVGIWLIRFDIGLTRGSLGGAPLGYVLAPAGPLHDQETVWVSTAAPGGPTVSIFSLRNTSAVPVRIEGLIGYYGEDVAFGHPIALWIPASGPWYEAPGLDQLRPFEPATIQPGEELSVYVSGRAGPCAFGPSYDPERQYSFTDIAGFSQIGPELQIVFSVFGLASMEVIDTEQTFAEPIRPDCPAAEGSDG